MIPTEVSQFIPRDDFLLCRRVQYDCNLTLPSLKAVVTPDDGGVASAMDETKLPTLFELVRLGPKVAEAGFTEGDIVFLDQTYVRVTMGNEIAIFYIGDETYGVLRLRAVAGLVRPTALVQ